ncbi:amino acid adenylation domain-containing protein [Solibacillus sp. A46]|uniref:Amino acid adenylation domain-containing protein n=1 Tax=Solibacillus faecavium TaxID=2762221 RepID=A0ABR8XZT4_9BACL|nr:amino acid adenylation domain-containing protein [Solibacillus faecavium]MBD8037455.1 amino acid adenylation domain-containing protein [Solibacillus faecavium]
MNTILHKLNEIVLKQGDAIALKERNRQLTFTELNNESNKVASYLIDNGLEKGGFVAIYLKRSIDTVISLLGIIKAGGVYVSLDPSHPNERNSYIIDDINTSFIITNTDAEQNLDSLQLDPSMNILQLENIYANKAVNLTLNINDNVEDPCYTIFTSGTTGKPKGTLIRQKGIMNLVDYMQKDWQVNDQDKILQFATYSFDASVLDTFLSLLTGSMLYLIDDEERMSESNFLNVVKSEGITIIPVLPTVFFNRIVNHLTEENSDLFASVKLVGVGGELLTGDLARKFKSFVGDQIRFFNLYGPTEITVMATAYEVPKDLSNDVYSVPIGKQLPGNKVYIVNEDGKQCKENEIGELWVASIGISLGYLHNEEKTKEVFIPNPFDANIYEGIVYKTGDLVKQLADGNIEFVSRKDTQVKIRGHRIEIAEIETKMNEVDGVNNAVVVVEKEGDDQILKAFFTSNERIEHTAIIETLKTDLPSYMLPTKLKQLEDIPFAPTGKVDRKALGKMEADRVSLVGSREIIAPRNEIEKDLIDVWKKVLKIDAVSVKDNLFDIGGHSLKVIEILAHVKQTYPALTIKDFFDLKTVENLAEKVINTSLNQDIQFNGEFTNLTEWPVMPIKEQVREVNKILVTGATGFLGSHIAQKLLEEGKEVFLLVRGENAEQRVSETMQKYFNCNTNPLITVISGDLTKKFLGLSKEDFTELANNIDAIIHSAADVRHFGNREHFEKVNVQGTKNIFELVNINADITFHHISTVGVVQDLLTEGKWNSVKDMSNIPEDLQLDSVYTDTKMKAEKWILDQAKVGKQVFVYRMGNLAGRYSDGHFQSNIDENAFYRMLKLMILVNKAPNVQWMVDFTPIDFAADVVVKSALTAEHTVRVYHVCHPDPIPFAQFVSILNELDLSIEMVETAFYEDYILSDSMSEEIKNLAVAQLDGDGASDTNAVFDSQQTMKLLKIQHLPKIEKEYIGKLIQYASEQQFIKLAVYA